MPVPRIVSMCLPEEADPGPQQAHHPPRGHPPHGASCAGPQGGLARIPVQCQIYGFASECTRVIFPNYRHHLAIHWRGYSQFF